MTGTDKHAAEYTDRVGNRFRIEYEVANGLGAPGSGEFVGTFWALLTGFYHQAGYPGDPVSALAEHEWHGDKFADYFTKGENDDHE